MLITIWDVFDSLLFLSTKVKIVEVMVMMKQGVRIFCVLVLSGLFGTQSMAAAQKKISVMAFNTTDGTTLGREIAEQVHQALRKIGTIQVVGEVVARQGEEHAQAIALGQKYSLDQVVTGSVGQFLNTVVVDMRVIDLHHPTAKKALNTSGRADDMTRMVAQLMRYFAPGKANRKSPTVAPAEVAYAPVADNVAVVPVTEVVVPSAPADVEAVETVTTWAFKIVAEPEAVLVRMLNIKPKYTENMRLRPGAYSIQVSKPGYKTYRKWFRIRAKDVVLYVTLVKQ